MYKMVYKVWLHFFVLRGELVELHAAPVLAPIEQPNYISRHSNKDSLANKDICTDDMTNIKKVFKSSLLETACCVQYIN